MASKPAPAPRRRSKYSGKTLGRCRIGDPIGRGATATVFHAHYLPLKKDVAVKVLRADQAASDEARTKFIDEAKALARLDHPNVVRVFDVVEDQGFLLIIMDLVPGDSLADSLRKEGPADPETAVGWARDIALALDHAHSQNILHRDVKPANVILDDEDHAVLVDFGNAEAVGEAASRKGTAHYVAPEVFQGKRQDERTDTYSLGATLFHLLTGEPPYDGASVQEILKAHADGKLRTPSTVNPRARIPKVLDDLVKRSMAPARGYRYLAKDLAVELEAVVPQLAGGGGGGGRSRRRRSRSSAAARSSGPGAGLWIGIAAAVAIAVIVVLMANKKDAPPPPPDTTPTEVVRTEPEAGPDGDGTLDPGFDQRASGREAREQAARDAFREAELFAAKPGSDAAAIAARWESVATEYGEFREGRRAREEADAWKAKLVTPEERAAEQRAAAAAAAEMKETLATIDSLVRELRCAEALALLNSLSLAQIEDRDALRRRQKRLNELIGFTSLLAEALDGNPVSVARVRAGLGPAGDNITGASERGLVVGSGSGQRMLAWADLEPAEVVKLSRQVLRNAPEQRIALAAYCWETGLEKDAYREIDTALLTDRTGTVSGRIEELFGELDR